jgi:hypothetical protein
LTKRINELERKERELELLPESNQVERPEKTGFFHRLGQKLGLVKKSTPSKLERVRKLKQKLNIQLEKSEDDLKKSLITLSLDEQKEKERKRIEEKLLIEKKNAVAEEEVFGD